MNDLTQAWNEFRTVEPPVDAVIERAQADARQRRARWVTAGVAATVVATCATALTLTSGRGTPTVSATDVALAAFQADLSPAQSCDDLLATYHRIARKQVTENGWKGGWGGRGGPIFTTDYAADSLTSVRKGSVTRNPPPASPQTSSSTGTNTQEIGIDEPDIAKTDGKIVVRISGQKLLIDTISGVTPTHASELRLPRLRAGELLLSGTSVVAIGTDREGNGTRVIEVSVKNPAAPRITQTSVYSSQLLSARLAGSTVRLVLDEAPPSLDFQWPTAGISVKQARAANRQIVADTTLEDWVPTLDQGKGAKPLVDCTQVAAPDDASGLSTISIVGFTVGDASQSSVAVIGAADIAYSSADHVYLVDSRWWGRSPKSRVFQFDLQGTQAVHVATGKVAGSLADRWSLDEADGVLRLALGGTGATGRDNSVVTLSREGTTLVERGRLDDLGYDESIKSVRWFDNLAVVVTFREVDPLFTIDMSNPSAPTLAGKLKTPGYSGYLHPIGDDHLMGIGFTDGRAEDTQISIFDISNTSAVTVTAKTTLKGVYPAAVDDPRAFSWLVNKDTALTTVTSEKSVQVVRATLARGALDHSVVAKVSGASASSVRTLPLPNGRVVLSTDAGVSFLSLG